MISVRPCQILTVLSLVLGLLNQHQAFESCAHATNVEKALKKRAIGSVRKGVDDLARAPTDAAGRLDDELTGTEQTYRATSSQGIANDHDGQGPAPAITKVKLSLTRKAEIAKSLASHQKKIAEMRTEWQRITTSFESLKHIRAEFINLKDLRMNPRAESAKTIDDNLGELKIFHRYILHLVQNRLREMGGLGGIVIGTKKQEKEESYIYKGLGSSKNDRERNEIKQEDENLQHTREKYPQVKNVLGHSALHIVLRENIMAQKKQLEKSDVSVTAGNDPTLDETPRELQRDPSDLISDKLKAEKIQELNNILHSLTLSPFLESTLRSQHPLRRFKRTAFEFVFELIQFMYKFGMINKDHLRSLFKMQETQELIGRHLFDLLNVYRRDNLLPDMSLITKHWHTQNLHIILTELDKNQIKSITYTTLIGTLKSFTFPGEFWAGSPATVDGLFSEKELLSRLKKLEFMYLTKSKEVDDEDLDLINHLKGIVEHFQNPIQTNSGPQDPTQQKIDYIITFCVLKFIIDHHPKVIENCFSSSQEYGVFKHQFSLIQAGLTLHQQINQVLDERFSFQTDYLIQNSIPVAVAKIRTNLIKVEIHNLLQKFIEIQEKVLKISKTNLKVNEWIHETSISKDIISFFKRRAFFVQTDPGLVTSITIGQYRNSFLI